MKNSRIALSLITFNTMGVFSFDSLHGFLSSINFVKRQYQIASILSQEDADFICLQEVHTYSFLKILKRNLTQYKYIAYKSFIYGPRGGMVIFSKHPFKTIEYINFKKRGTFFNTSFIARLIKNGILKCEIEKMPLVVLNTHTTPNLDHNYLAKNRFIKYTDAQLSQIAGLFKKLSKNKQNVILGGDLNVSQNSESLTNFLKVSGAIDVFDKYLTPTQHQEFLPKQKKVMRIDYIIVSNRSDNIRIESSSEIFTKKYLLANGKNRYLSDHIGLRTEFSLQDN